MNRCPFVIGGAFFRHSESKFPMHFRSKLFLWIFSEFSLLVSVPKFTSFELWSLISDQSLKFEFLPFNFDSKRIESLISSFRPDRLAKERAYYAKEIEKDRAQVHKFKEEQKEYESKKAVRHCPLLIVLWWSHYGDGYLEVREIFS